MGFDIASTVEDCYCAKFQVIPMRKFRFFRANLPPHTPTYTHREKVIAIFAPTHNVAGEDNINN